MDWIAIGAGIGLYAIVWLAFSILDHFIPPSDKVF